MGVALFHELYNFLWFLNIHKPVYLLLLFVYVAQDTIFYRFYYETYIFEIFFLGLEDLMHRNDIIAHFNDILLRLKLVIALSDSPWDIPFQFSLQHLLLYVHQQLLKLVNLAHGGSLIEVVKKSGCVEIIRRFLWILLKLWWLWGV